MILIENLLQLLDGINKGHIDKILLILRGVPGFWQRPIWLGFKNFK